ncbi:MAG TPA: M17 family peptidase N-terminal domain-containing protein, partial [Polyangia bacterium]
MTDLAATSTDAADIDADLLVLAVAEPDLDRGDWFAGIDARVGGVLRRAAGEERFRAKLGQTLIVHVRDVRPQRVALVGLGAAPDPSGQALRVAAGSAARVATGVGAARVAFAWSAAGVTIAEVRACEVAAEGALLGGYRFDKYLTDERSRRPALAAFTLRPPSGVAAPDAAPAFARAQA